MALAKKFSAIHSYRISEEAGYKLLPVRFTRLDDKRYVISNISGEYRVLSRTDLEDLIHHRLPVGSPLRDDMKAAHFIYDEDSSVAIPLLGIKYRSKLGRTSQFTALHIFVVTLRCDYTCQYCQVSRQTEDLNAFDMSKEAAERAVNLVFKSPSRAIKIEFQGGEPLLNFDLIKYIVKIAKAKNETELRDLSFVIASNLSLLTDEILDYCEEHSIFFSTSLDGPATLHDKNRPKPNRDGHKLTVAGIDKIRGRLGHDAVSALMTTTERSLNCVEEIIDEYVSKGFNSIFLRSLSPYGFAAKAGHYAKYDADRWLGFYKHGLRYILEINKNGVALTETFAAIILRKMLTPQNPGYVDLQSPAGTGISAIVYNYDGDVYAGDEARMLAEMGDTTFRMGNLFHNSYEELFLSDEFLDPLESSVIQSIPICTDCAFLPYCGTDPVYHHATQGDPIGNRTSSGFCHRNIGIFRHLIMLMEDSNEDRKILESWAWGR